MGETGKGVILVLVSAAGFGSMAVLAKVAYAGGANVVTVLALRFTAGALLLWALLGLNLTRWSRRREAHGGASAAGQEKVRVAVGLKKSAYLFGMGALGYGAVSTLYFASLRYLPSSAVAMFFYSYPAFVTILAYLFFRERLERRKILALFLSASGTLLMLWAPGLKWNTTGVLLVLFGALIYSLYIMAVTKAVSMVTPEVMSVYVISAAAILFLGYGFVAGQLRFALTLPAWLAIGAIAVFSTVVAIAAFAAGLQKLGPAWASIVSTFEPVVTVLLAVTLLGERLTVYQLAGGMLIMGGVLLLQWVVKVKTDRQPQPTGAR